MQVLLNQILPELNLQPSQVIHLSPAQELVLDPEGVDQVIPGLAVNLALIIIIIGMFLTRLGKVSDASVMSGHPGGLSAVLLPGVRIHDTVRKKFQCVNFG